ncbi:MAG: hypothetical protein IEMM0008_0597 [bacterium]|nr:MAG: hypothetical protein IEMM0008_0597 [bacterium]
MKRLKHLFYLLLLLGIFQNSYAIKFEVDQHFQVFDHPVTSLALSKDENSIAIGSQRGKIKIMDMKSHFLADLGFHDAGVTALKWIQDDQTLISGSNDTTIKCWDIKTHAVQVMREHKGPVYCIAIDPTGQWIASGSTDGQVILWKPQSNKIKRMKKHHGAIRSVAFSPNGKLLVSGGGEGDNRVILWKVSTDQILEISRHAKAVYSVGFKPDGKSIIIGGADHKVHIWNILKRKGKSYSVAQKTIRQLTYHPVMPYIFIIHGDNNLYLLNYKTMKSSLVYRHTSKINGIVIKKDGSAIILGDESGQVVYLKEVKNKNQTPSMTGDHIRVQLLSPKILSTSKKKVTIIINVTSSRNIKKVMIFSLNGYSRTWTYTLASKTRQVEIGDTLMLIEGKNPIFVMILDETGMTTQRFTIHQQK